VGARHHASNRESTAYMFSASGGFMDPTPP
jgi:hypothetical protein